MYIEGCMWDRAKEQCVINSERDDDGDKSRTPMGCMKCGSIKHNHACNSMANCFWDNQTDGPTGICKACSEFNTMTNGLPDPSGSPDEDSCNNKSNRKQKQTRTIIMLTIRHITTIINTNNKTQTKNNKRQKQ